MDYSGYTPDDVEPMETTVIDLAEYRDSVTLTPISKLINDMVESTVDAREKILRNLVESPGIVATFGDDFEVEFSPVEVHTTESMLYNSYDEYRLQISQKWRIRRKDADGTAGRSPLGGDAGGETREGESDPGA